MKTLIFILAMLTWSPLSAAKAAALDVTPGPISTPIAMPVPQSVVKNVHFISMTYQNIAPGVTEVRWKSLNFLTGRPGLVLTWLWYSQIQNQYSLQAELKVRYDPATKESVFWVPLSPPFFMVGRMADELNEHSTAEITVVP